MVKKKTTQGRKRRRMNSTVLVVVLECKILPHKKKDIHIFPQKFLIFRARKELKHTLFARVKQTERKTTKEYCLRSSFSDA